MTTHIKKIMDEMLIFTILTRYFTDKNSERFYKQVKKLVCNGYKDILVDFTNVDSIDEKVTEVIYELHKLVVASGGSLKIFGVNPDVSDSILNNQFGCFIKMQVNEIIEDDMMDMLFHKQFSLVS